MYGIIPAAGRGTRLRPITEAIPKELLLFGNKTLIEHVLLTMAQAGVTRACVVTGEKKGPVIDFIKDGSLFGLNIDFAYQHKPLGPGHAVLCAKNKMTEHDDAFVIFGDTVIQPISEAKRLMDVHRKEKPLVTVFFQEVKDPKRWGIIKGRKNSDGTVAVTDLHEKPQTVDEQNKMKSGDVWLGMIGAYCLNKKFFDYIESAVKNNPKETFITDAMVAAVTAGEKIIAVPFSGQWLDIGAPETYLMSQWEYFRGKSKEEIVQLAREWEDVAKKINSP